MQAGRDGPSEAGRLALLRAVARSDGGATQRSVAATLGVTKREARMALLAAKREGVVGETIDDRPSAPGRRLFWLTLYRGRSELERLEGSRHPPDASRSGLEEVTLGIRRQE